MLPSRAARAGGEDRQAEANRVAPAVSEARKASKVALALAGTSGVAAGDGDAEGDAEGDAAGLATMLPSAATCAAWSARMGPIRAASWG